MANFFILYIATHSSEVHCCKSRFWSGIAQTLKDAELIFTRHPKEILDKHSLRNNLVTTPTNIATSALGRSNLRNNLNKGKNLIYSHYSARGICDKSSRAEFQNSMCVFDLFFQQNSFRAVWLSGSRVTRICCLISEKRTVRIQQNLVRSFVIDCFMGA